MMRTLVVSVTSYGLGMTEICLFLLSLHILAKIHFTGELPQNPISLFLIQSFSVDIRKHPAPVSKRISF
jgi:hypothetical protein